jgi:hypothetical protein
MFELLAIAVSCLVYVKGTRALVAYRDREQRWREADANKRKRIVREECALRVIGRVLGAGGLAIGACTVGSAGLAAMWALVAWRVVKPIKAEMREACSYRSTGSIDEAPYPW